MPRHDPRKIKNQPDILPGRPTDWRFGQPTQSRHRDLILRDLEKTKLEAGSSVFGDTVAPPDSVLVFTGADWDPVLLTDLLTLDDLSDVEITAPAADDVLMWDGSAWVNAPITELIELNDLSDVDTAAEAEGDFLIRNALGLWSNRNWTPGEFGVGAAVVDGKFKITSDDTATWFSDTNVAGSSGLQGWRLGKQSTGTAPVGISLVYLDTGELLWDTAAIDYLTDDLILAFSHELKADNLRFRRDTAQASLGRVVGTPAIGGGQLQVVSGAQGVITGITQAASAVVTISGTHHKFAVGESVTFRGVAGMTGINGLTGTITARDDTTFTVNINSSGFGAYTSGGEAYVQMSGVTLTGYGNSFNLLLLQGLATGTKRTKISFNNNFQFGTDANQNGTADYWWFNNATGNFPFYISALDRIFFKGTSSAVAATAHVQIGAGVAAASGAPLKFSSGVNLTTAEAGAWEYDGTNLYFTPSGTTRRTVDYLPVTPPDYTVANHTDSRSLDETGATLGQLANVVGTLINDLIAQGRLQ